MISTETSREKAGGMLVNLLRISGLLPLLFLQALSPAAETPNIVYIIADDHAWTDYGFMGNDRVHTPNLDALARQSARFVNGYVPSSVCRPSLATLLTGLFPHQHGIHFNHGPPGNGGYNKMKSRGEYERIRKREFELIRKVSTLPGILDRELGYKSFQAGKFWEGHWRNGGFTEGMTTFEPCPSDQNFGGTRTLADGASVAHGNGDVGLQIGRRTMTPIYNFIDACTSAEAPWMVWYAPYLPHQPHDSPQRFYDLARRRNDVAEHELPYFASIAEFDETVGDLVRHVENAGQARNTIFVFVSDNGWRPSHNRQKGRPQEFAHTKRSKRAPFDDGLRTPVLIRWDGVAKPGTYSGLVSTIDLMPTMLAATGLKSEPSLPGLSLLPIVEGKADIDAARAVWGAIYPGDATSLGNPERDVAYRWIRQGRYKLIVPHLRRNGPWNGYVEQVALFDLRSDPHEEVDLATLPQQQANIALLRKRLDKWWAPN